MASAITNLIQMGNLRPNKQSQLQIVHLMFLRNRPLVLLEKLAFGPAFSFFGFLMLVL